MKELPKISIATCTYNGERIIRKYFEGIFSQNYPLNKIEVVINEAGSTDKTVEIIKEYIKKYPKNIKFMHNPKKYTEGRGFGNDQVTRATNGEVIVIADQDNIFVQKNWIRNIVKILMENPDISGVQSRMLIPKNGTMLDKYLNDIGIEDPFAIPYSLNAQITFHPEKFNYNFKGDFYNYKVNLRNFLYAGANGFVVKRKDFFEADGYIQDTENFYNMALKGQKVVVPRNIRMHHQTSTKVLHFLRKRIYFVMYYLLNNYEDRKFYWISLKKNSFKQNMKFINMLLFNLAFFPGMFQGILMALKKRRAYWLIHGLMLWLMTTSYIYAWFYIRIFKKIGLDFKH